MVQKKQQQMRLYEAIEEFLTERRPNWRNKTLIAYEASFRSFKGYFNRNILVSAITTKDLSTIINSNQYYTTKTPRPRTRAKRFDHLYNFFRWLHDSRWAIDQNPMTHVQRPVVDEEIRPIPSTEDLLEFIRRCPPPFNKICLLMASIGPRAGELLRNSKNWIPPVLDNERKCLRFLVTKTHKWREVPVPDVCLIGMSRRYKTMFDFLKAHADDSGNIDFGITTHDMWQITKIVWRSMGKNFCVQTLRAFCGTHLTSILNGTYIPSKILGNSERTMLKSYARPLWNDMVNAVNSINLINDNELNN